MIALNNSLAAWGTSGFEAVLKAEIAAASIEELQLQQALRLGNTVLEGTVQAMLISAEKTDNTIHARVGLFFKSIIAGCACDDDPTPGEEQNEYCEVQLDIKMPTAKTTILAVSE